VNLERSEQLVQEIENSIRKIIPANELESISDNIGIPLYYDLGFYQPDSVAAQDTDILIQLQPKHHPTQTYQNQIRRMLAYYFPGVVGYFQAADIVSEVLNFGLPAMIDAQISGNDLESDYAYAARLQGKLKRTAPGTRRSIKSSAFGRASSLRSHRRPRSNPRVCPTRCIQKLPRKRSRP
jgi:hypothetical protein